MGLLPLQADIVEFVEAGALGFILKNATVKEFLSTIQSVVQGEKVLPPSFTGSSFFILLKSFSKELILISSLWVIVFPSNHWYTLVTIWV